jgi:hypothetical protein
VVPAKGFPFVNVQVGSIKKRSDDLITPLVDAAPSLQIEPLKIMTSAKLPADQFTDYSLIFN